MPGNDSFNELEPLSALLADLTEYPEPDRQTNKHRRGEGRRRKAAVVLAAIWGGTIALHFFAWGYWFVFGMTTLIGIHAARILLARPLPLPKPMSDADLEQAPFVSLMVAAKNEEAVISRLVKDLCSLDYPNDCYELWVIDDNSTDRTPILLDKLVQEYPQLRVYRRNPGAGGGKSGALNQVLPLTQGSIIAVFDADAQVAPDMLRRVLPMFDRKDLGAVQLRKSISNVSRNGWIRGQIAEMALDSYFQQKRIAIGGIGELRGNGQFVRRTALDRCGGWNEETITDDLDLTIRLHLDRWDVDFVAFPAVEEEGVTRATALWHQRSRWAEGGYQRYLDYWQPILRNRMGSRKTLDLLMFWITQYFLPTAMLPDLLMAVLRSHSLVLSPMTTLTVPLSVMGMMIGLRQIHHPRQPDSVTRSGVFSRFGTLLQALQGTVYMLHWIPVVASTTARLSVRPKRLKWVKTVHQGDEDLLLDLPKQS